MARGAGSGARHAYSLSFIESGWAFAEPTVSLVQYPPGYAGRAGTSVGVHGGRVAVLGHLATYAVGVSEIVVGARVLT